MPAEMTPIGMDLNALLSVDGATLLAILGMAAATYAVRVGGFALLRRIPPDSFAEAWLKHVPGAMFAAMLAPALLRGGLAEWLGAVVILLVARRGAGLPLVLALGVGTVFALRALMG